MRTTTTTVFGSNLFQLGIFRAEPSREGEVRESIALSHLIALPRRSGLIRRSGQADAIGRDLMVNGLIRRYRTAEAVEGLRGEEGTFLACSFWLVDAYIAIGRRADAEALFDRLLALRNDLGLLAEEYDTHAKRQTGNFPQALTHIALINTAHNLSEAKHAAEKPAVADWARKCASSAARRRPMRPPQS